LEINGTNFLQNHSTVSNGGGGLYLKEGNFTISSSSFSANQSIHDGGAALLVDTNGTISDSNFTDNLNAGSNGGGALFIESSPVTIANCNFFRNKTNANNHGGAIKVVSSSPVIQGCDFQYNQSTLNSGGALFIDEASNPTLEANAFKYNSSASWGGAIYSKNSNFVISGGLFIGNWSRFGGGIATFGVEKINLNNIKAFANEANSSSDAQGGFLFLGTGATESKIINCVIAGNKSSYRHGVLSTNGEVRFANCTLYGNEAVDSGGISLLFSGDSLIFENSIIWANTDRDGYEVYVNTGYASAEYSLLTPGNSPSLVQGVGLVFSEPSFSDANGIDDMSGTVDDDFTLSSGSPAIGAGSSSFSNYVTSDLSGRIRDSLPDIGAYEYYVNMAPSFVGSTSFTVLENTTTIADLNATDVDGDPLTFSLVGGADQSNFLVDASSGVLSFKTAPDFSNPGDADGNNLYEVKVGVTDSVLSVELVLEVTVEDVNMAPSFVGSTSYTVLENTTTIADLNATDADGDPLIFSLVGGADQSSFLVDASSGVLSFKTAPDFEYPTDLDANNTYAVIVEITDGYLSERSTLLIAVKDVDESAVNAESAKLLVNGFALQDNWREVSWFGTYYSKFFPWVYQDDLGWLYVVQAKSGETWMWQHSLGWLWTDMDVFPYFYINATKQWAYAGSELQSGKYYSYKSGEEGWVDLD
jgi:predicted outer membrane repeat protein